MGILHREQGSRVDGVIQHRAGLFDIHGLISICIFSLCRRMSYASVFTAKTWQASTGAEAGTTIIVSCSWTRFLMFCREWLGIFIIFMVP